MHYTVAVITEDGDYDTALAPFSKHLEVDSYLDKTREELIAEKKKDLEWSRLEKNSQWRHYLESNYDWTNDNTLLESIRKRDTDDGYTFDKEGNRYTTYNPNSKWDWYVLGGRWSHLLYLKPVIIKGKRYGHGRTTDEAHIKDIDFQHYELTKKERAHYSRKWDIIVNGSPLGANEKEADFYDYLFETKNSLLTDYGNKETYLREVKAFRTAALLYDNKWYSPDDDSCFSTNHDRIRAYNKKYEEILDNLIKCQSDLVLSVIDCHI